MRHRLGAVAVLLALSALMPRLASGQQSSPPPPPVPRPSQQPTQQKPDSTPQARRERSLGFQLGQNYPNPFNPETKIPFRLGDESCTDTGRKYRVTLRIY